MSGKGSEQFRIGWRVGQADVIDRLDQTASEQMSPDAVGDVACEITVLRSGHPLGQYRPPVALGVGVGHAGFQGVSVDQLSGAGVLGLGIAGGSDRFAGGTRLESDLREKGLHAPVIRLSPPVVGMMVALGTIDSHSEKDLRDDGGPVAGFADRLVEDCLGVLTDRAAGGQQFPGELVDGRVFGKPIADPAVVVVGRFVAELEAIDPQQVRPFQRPVVGVLGSLQQPVDAPSPSVAVLVLEELPRFLGCRQPADDVEADSTKEGGVVGSGRGQDVEFLEFLVDQGVDEVGFGQLGETGQPICTGDHGLEDPDGSHVVGHHGHLPGCLSHRHQPELVDVAQPLVVRLELGVAGHVSRASVGERRHHPQLVPALHVDLAFAGGQLDRHHLRVVVVAKWHAAGDPVVQSAVVSRTTADADTAAVGNAAGGLGQQQAAGRQGWNHTSPATLAGQGHVVGHRVQPEARQLEPVLAFGLAVAARRVAREAAHQRHDVAFEVVAPRSLRTADLHGDPFHLLADLHLDRPRSIGHAVDDSVRRDFDDPGSHRAVSGLTGQVRLRADVRSRGYQELVHCGGPVEQHAGGADCDRRGFLAQAGTRQPGNQQQGNGDGGKMRHCGGRGFESSHVARLSSSRHAGP